MNGDFAEIMGWIGTVTYIIAYLLLSLRKLKAEKALYHCLNVLGSVGLMINGFYYGNFPSVFVNIAWFIIATLAIIIIVRRWRAPSDGVVE